MLITPNEHVVLTLGGRPANDNPRPLTITMGMFEQENLDEEELGRMLDEVDKEFARAQGYFDWKDEDKEEDENNIINFLNSRDDNGNEI